MARLTPTWNSVLSARGTRLPLGMRSLQKSRAQVTPEIQAKAQELTRDKKTEDEKVQALYNYVSEKFRYIGISLGVGRYQPHAASEVLANGFGDCKDKHTLLSALLQAVGVNSYPVLIHSSIKLDPDVPTPAIFDHVITAIPKGDKFVWLDTTPGTAPFGLVMEPLRGKLALIVMDGDKGLVDQRSERFAVRSVPSFHYGCEAQRKACSMETRDSKLAATTEIIIRMAFRNTPESKWQELVQVVSQSLGFAGTVSDVKVAPPDETSNPFWFSYKYHRPDYGDWPNHQIILPFPVFHSSAAFAGRRESEWRRASQRSGHRPHLRSASHSASRFYAVRSRIGAREQFFLALRFHLQTLGFRTRGHSSLARSSGFSPSQRASFLRRSQQEDSRRRKSLDRDHHKHAAASLPILES